MPVKDTEIYRYILANSPGVRLLGQRDAFAFSFLHDVFRNEGLNGIKQTDFTGRLVKWLSEMQEEIEDEEDIVDAGEEFDKFSDVVLQKRAKYLTERWISPDKGFLTRSYDKDQNPSLQPDPSVLFAFSFVEDLENSRHIGVESSFDAICRDMQDFVANTVDNPEEAILMLEKQKAECEKKIREIRENKDTAGWVAGYSEEKKGERIAALAKSMKNFIGSLPQIRQNFVEILDEMRRRDNGSMNGTEIAMQAARMTLDVLDNTEQGRSYYAFFKLINGPGSRAEFNKLTDQIISETDQTRYKDEYRVINNFMDDVREMTKDIKDTINMIADRIVNCMGRTESKTFKTVDAMMTKLLSNITLETMEDLSFEFEKRISPTLSMDRTLRLEKTVYKKVNLKGIETKAEEKADAIEMMSRQASVNPDRVTREILEYARKHDGKVTLSDFLSSRGKTMGITYVTETISQLMTKSRYKIMEERCRFKTKTGSGDKFLSINDIEGVFDV